MYGEMRTFSTEPGRLSPRMSAESTLGTILLRSWGAGAMLVVNVDTKEITSTSKNSETFTVKNRDAHTLQVAAEEGFRALILTWNNSEGSKYSRIFSSSSLQPVAVILYFITPVLKPVKDYGEGITGPKLILSSEIKCEHFPYFK